MVPLLGPPPPGGDGSSWASGSFRDPRRALCAGPARPEAPARVSSIENMGIIACGLGVGLIGAALQHPVPGGPRVRRRAPPRRESRRLQGPALPRRRVGDSRGGHRGDRAARRPPPPHAMDRRRVPDRRRWRSRGCLRSTASSSEFLIYLGSFRAAAVASRRGRAGRIVLVAGLGTDRRISRPSAS